MHMQKFTNAKPLPNIGCVVKVGGGCGFIIEHRVKLPPMMKVPRSSMKMKVPVTFVAYRLVITAAHCLGPKLPPACGVASYVGERTYKKLLGTLDGKNSGVWAECLFVDPVADIGLLGCPDEQAFPDDQPEDAYHDLTDNVPPLRIGKARSGRGWVLSPSGRRWIPTRLEVFRFLEGDSLSIDPTEPGMSGSPILNAAGRAVGVVAVGAETVSASGERKPERSGGQPILACNLPGWLLH